MILRDEEPVYIYALIDPRDNRPRYVGRSVNPRARLTQHLHDENTKNPKAAWIDELRLAGLEPEMQILAESNWRNCSKDEWSWICKLREQERDLTNVGTGNTGRMPYFSKVELVVEVFDSELSRLIEDARYNNMSVSQLVGYMIGKYYADIDTENEFSFRSEQTRECMLCGAIAPRGKAIPHHHECPQYGK